MGGMVALGAILLLSRTYDAMVSRIRFTASSVSNQTPFGGLSPPQSTRR